MRIHSLALRRKALDDQLGHERDIMSPPVGGWIRAIRESLGMTLESFGQRLGVTRATAHQIERAEVNESITIKRLRAAADALGCDLSIQLVPRQSLNSTVRERAYEIAKADIDYVNHSMMLEGQAIYDKERNEMIEELAQEIVDRNERRLWTSE